MPADDDDAVMARLAALEAEVKADADAVQARRAATQQKVASQRVAAERAAIVERSTRPAPAPAARRERPRDRDDLGDALALARKASDVKHELARTPGEGEKSWIKSGVASLVLGPLGWLYAGSLREAVPASAAWILFAVLASKFVPFMLLFPVLLFAMPASGIAGALYAMRYNRKGGRQRLFSEPKPKKARPAKQLETPIPDEE